MLDPVIRLRSVGTWKATNEKAKVRHASGARQEAISQLGPAISDPITLYTPGLTASIKDQSFYHISLLFLDASLHNKQGCIFQVYGLSQYVSSSFHSYPRPD